MRRQRTPGSWLISTHSKVARPSGPEKLQVISQMPGAPSTSRMRNFLGHGAVGSRRRRSQAGWKSFRTTARNLSRSRLVSRPQSPSNAGVISNFTLAVSRSASHPGARTGPRDHRPRSPGRRSGAHRLPAPWLATVRTRTIAGGPGPAGRAEVPHGRPPAR